MFHECIPDRKWRQYCKLVETKKAILDPLLLQVDAVRHGKLEDDDIAYALDLIEDPEHKDGIIAFLLSGEDLMGIATWLRIPLPVLEIFCALCFDRNEFRNKLELRSYARKYAREIAQPENTELIASAILLGPKYMMYHFQTGNEEMPMDPREFAKNLIHQAFHISRVARGNPINSPASKEALRWLNAASKLITGYDKVPGDDLTDDDSEAMIAIEEVKISRSVTELGLAPDDIPIH